MNLSCFAVRIVAPNCAQKMWSFGKTNVKKVHSEGSRHIGRCCAPKERECTDSSAPHVTVHETSQERPEEWHSVSDIPSVMLTTVLAAGMGDLMGLFPDLAGPASAVEAILILCGIVAFHELGHFSAARIQGIHVSKFSIGFGPALLKYKPGDVEYSLRALPLGGFVAFPDNDEHCPYPEDDPNLLKNRPILDRVLVVSAGMFLRSDRCCSCTLARAAAMLPMPLPARTRWAYRLQSGTVQEWFSTLF
jgi:hypothetical protein